MKNEKKKSAIQVVKEIKRRTRRIFSAEEKIKIVLEGMRGEQENNAPHRNTFVKNIIENNGTDGGGFGLSINSPATDLVLKENIFKNSLKTQEAAIYIYKAGLKPKLMNNQFEKHKFGEVVFEKE